MTYARLQYTLMALITLAGIGAPAAAPFFTPPKPDSVTGVLFPLGTSSERALAAVVAADDRVAVIDSGWRGALIFVRSHDPAFPQRVLDRGAVHSFDAVSAGCHSDDAVSRPAAMR